MPPPTPSFWQLLQGLLGPTAPPSVPRGDIVLPREGEPAPEPPLGWLAPYLEGGTELIRGAAGLGEQGPAGPTWTNAGALLAALPLTSLTSLGGLRKATEEVLDVSHAGRTARAAEQGYLIDALHGRSGDYEAVAIPSWKRSSDAGAVGEGFYASPATAQGADIAGWYASQAGPRENLMPVKLKLHNPLRIAATPGDDPRPAVMRQLSKEWGLKEQPRFSGSKQLNPDWAAEFSDALRARGFDGVVTDLGSVKEYMVLSPQQVRSANAAFDPRKVLSPNLLAGLGGGALLSSLARPAQPEKR